MKVVCGGSSATLDYLLAVGSTMLMASYFDRSQQVLRGIGAAMHTDSFYIDGRRVTDAADNDTWLTPIVNGKERFFHAVTVNKIVNKHYILTTAEGRSRDFYSYFMKNYDLPLRIEWMPELIEAVAGKERLSVYGDLPADELCIPFGGGMVPVNSLEVYTVSIDEGRLESTVTRLIKSKRISVCDYPQQKLDFKDMDDYFSKFGPSLVENLRKQLTPVAEHTQEIDKLTLKTKRLYPQQISQINGVIELFLQNKSKYAILNMGMGCGKTLQASSMIEGYFVAKAMKKYNCTLEQAYKEHREDVNYRNVVMCPSHLVNKWCEEINKEIPYAKAVAVTDFKQLLDIRKNGCERNGKEFFVMSKDFAKLSYQSKPVVKRYGKRQPMVMECPECGEMKPRQQLKDNICHSCDKGAVFVKKPAPAFPMKGMLCPECGELLFSIAKNLTFEKYSPDDNSEPLQAHDFAGPTSGNQACYYCGCELWQPCVANLDCGGEYSSWVNRSSPWKRITHYANKTHKGKKTVWVHKAFEQEYLDMVGEQPLNEKDDFKGARKYSPAAFIKKYLKGYFDVAVFDEMHLYKGGATAQGNAMHALIKASKFQLGLTGTIAGGYANHLFYTLFRLDPARMVKQGFKFTDEMAFCERYGTVERTYAVEENKRYNTISRGKQLCSPKVKPGISPLIFTEYLLDKAVFLDLSDMSRFLPPLKEKVVTVPLEDEIFREYHRVVDRLRSVAKQGEGRGILSKMLQFSLSFSDKPYGVQPIKSPYDGSTLITPKSFDEYSFDDTLLNKEKKLVELINSELAEGRNCMVFAEYTASPETCITHRLKGIIEDNCGLRDHEVAILESESPAAIKREEWIHDKAEKGAKVFITNPKCVETGLDLCFEKNGRSYNYPTLIFYQLGYSLFTIWQASRRHFRLNQREECRTYYMASEGTVQPAVIQLIAEKQVATAAIQGHFSSEGLSAMAQGVDTRLKLAQALASKDTKSENQLQNMFDVLATNRDDTDLSNFVPMKTLSELLGKDKEEPVSDVKNTSGFDMFDMVSMFSGDDLFNNKFFVAALMQDKKLDTPQSPVTVAEKSKKRTAKIKVECMSLFDFI